MAKKRVTKKKKNSSKFEGNLQKIFVLVALIVLNVFIGLNVFLPILGIILGLVVAGFAMVIAGTVGFLFSIIYPFFPGSWVVSYVEIAGISSWAFVFLSLSIACFGGLLSIANYYIAKYSSRGLIWYIELNKKIFKKYGY
jgi:uncharacterized membrane protein